MKTIIAIWGGENIGKSSNVLTLAEEVMKVYPAPIHKIIYANPVVPKVDFRLILNVKGKIIAFESMGDPNTGLNKRLPEIIALYKPDVLICTCRSKGYTVLDVEKGSKKNGS